MNHAMTRRAFCAASAISGVGLLAGVAPTAQATSPLPDPQDSVPWPTLLGCWSIGKQQYAGIWSAQGGAHGIELGFRAHKVLQDPRRPDQAVAVGRRPGQHLVRFDLLTGMVISKVAVEPGRNLNGHCCFSVDAKYLYTTENDTMAGQGCVVVREAVSLAKTAAFPSYGIGPHDLMVEEGNTLLIANGGVLTIPKAGNGGPSVHGDRMDPSLVRIDAGSGRLLGQWRLPDPFLSIRHLARGSHSTVGVALQAAHPTDEQRGNAPVLALFDGEGHFEIAGDAAPQPLKGYGGDVAAIADGEHTLFAVGCSHANAIAWWDRSGRWKGSVALRGACAVTTGRGISTLALTEYGEAVQAAFDGQAITERPRHTGLAWDNHAVVMPDPF